MRNIDRRIFIRDSALLTAGLAAGSTLLSTLSACASSEPFTFSQDKLPYGYNALEPVIDARTMEIHYSKHHATYVKNANEAIAGENLKYASAEELFKDASKLSDKIRNNGGGVWNHNFFWSVMSAPSTETPPSSITDAINGSFGSMDNFKAAFSKAAADQFGSGWAWLVKDGDKLKVGGTPNQDNPLMDDAEFKGTPLLGIDVWEHAYYLKYQNERKKYIENWFQVVNWERVASLL